MASRVGSEACATRAGADRAGAGSDPVGRSARRRPESNRCTRLCRPLRSHSATSPGASEAIARLVGDVVPARRARPSRDQSAARPRRIALLAVTVCAVSVTILAWQAITATPRGRRRGRSRQPQLGGPRPRDPRPATRRAVAPAGRHGGPQHRVAGSLTLLGLPLPGRLAQLGERRLDKAEVTGSSPVSPTFEVPCYRRGFRRHWVAPSDQHRTVFARAVRFRRDHVGAPGPLLSPGSVGTRIGRRDGRGSVRQDRLRRLDATVEASMKPGRAWRPLSTTTINRRPRKGTFCVRLALARMLSATSSGNVRRVTCSLTRRARHYRRPRPSSSG